MLKVDRRMRVGSDPVSLIATNEAANWRGDWSWL